MLDFLLLVGILIACIPAFLLFSFLFHVVHRVIMTLVMEGRPRIFDDADRAVIAEAGWMLGLLIILTFWLWIPFMLPVILIRMYRERKSR